MAIVQSINLGLRFALELSLLGALGYAGFQLDAGWPARLLVGIGLPLIAAVIWGLFVAPKASHLLTEPWRFAVELGLFTLGAVALWVVGQTPLALALLALFLLNRLLMVVWSQ